MNEWYTIKNINDLDSPALVVYRDRVKENIGILIRSIDDINRLRPHVKTNKTAEVCVMMLQAGISKFKCATIAEAEMLAIVGAGDVLLAYQPVGPKAQRLLVLIQKYPTTNFACLVDNFEVAAHLSETFSRVGLSLPVFIDLNLGMNRTGIPPSEALKLYHDCQSLHGITMAGLHAYDGHIRDSDFQARKNHCDKAFAPVLELQKAIEAEYDKFLPIVAGGTPTYSIHSRRANVECSPGTFIYSDYGYKTLLAEQPYLPAALVVTRVISKPAPHTICVDLGHKSIASENPLPNRVFFLNADDLTPIGHSEEHMIFSVGDKKEYQLGDVLYGIPYHVCPTVALFDQVSVVENNLAVTQWKTLARNRKITV